VNLDFKNREALPLSRRIINQASAHARVHEWKAWEKNSLDGNRPLFLKVEEQALEKGRIIRNIQKCVKYASIAITYGACKN